jgi:hypothetical protein
VGMEAKVLVSVPRQAVKIFFVMPHSLAALSAETPLWLGGAFLF